MEEKTINEKESLELIAQMIKQTKTRLGKGAGNEYLVWGYSCIVASVVVMVLAVAFHTPHAAWGYFLIPVLGLTGTAVLRYRNRKADKGEATTYIEKSLKTLYECAGVAFLGYLAICLLHLECSNIWKGMFFLGMFIPAFCGTVAGTLLQIKKIKNYSEFALVVSCCFLVDVLISGEVKIQAIILGIICWTCSLVVPGRIINREAKKQSDDERA